MSFVFVPTYLSMHHIQQSSTHICDVVFERLLYFFSLLIAKHLFTDKGIFLINCVLYSVLP